MRTPSTTAFKRGAIVLLPFPYTDQSGTKRRPALILSTDAYNLRRTDLIVAPITSNLAGRQPDDTVLSDWAAAGLLKPSAVKGILGTVEQTLVLRPLGRLSAADLQQVEQTFAAALGLPVVLPPSSSP
jgi:mRNA interferase MazF